jgi:3-oxoacyl-[acyl-carrier protein] reductase
MPSSTASVDGRVALVTGSTRGLGAAIARRLAADGLRVAVNGATDDGEGKDVVAAIRGEGGVAELAVGDVTHEGQVAHLVAVIEDCFGPVEVLVINATGPQPDASIEDTGWDEHVAELDFFVKSPVLVGRAVLPAMRAARFGRIVQIDSEVADRPPPGRSAYATAKAAQIGLARSWARELAPFGITVNCVAPGFVPVERHDGVAAEVFERYLASVPMRRFGGVEDVAHAVSFFASDAAGFVTGQRLVVDGGRGLG